MTTTPLHFLNTADALTLITQFDTATDEYTIVALLRTLSQQMGFDHFRLGFIFPNSIQRPEVRIFNGCPSPWVQTYDEKGLFAVDPGAQRDGSEYADIVGQSHRRVLRATRCNWARGHDARPRGWAM